MHLAQISVPPISVPPISVAAEASVEIPPRLLRELLRKALPYLPPDEPLWRDVRAVLGFPVRPMEDTDGQ